MKHLSTAVLFLSALAAAGVQQPDRNNGSLRITVQVPGSSQPVSGIAVTLVRLPNPTPSTLVLPETEQAWLAYVQNPAPANAPVTVAGRTILTSAEARQKLLDATQPSLPPGQTIFEIGEGVSQPLLIRQAVLEYSDDARRNRVQGTVEAVAVVRPDGTIAAAEITKSVGYGLDEKAVASVKQWRFSPAAKDGIPVPVFLTISANFNTRGNSTARTGITDARGFAVFDNLEAGKYAVRGIQEGLTGTTVAYVETGAVEAALPLKAAGTLNGVLTDSSGAPISGARIALGVLANQDGRSAFYPGSDVMTNARGEYYLTAIVPGEYYLRAQPLQTGPVVFYYPGTAALGQATALPVKAGQVVTAVDFAIPKE